MIVREEGESLLLITQPDHAALAATIMRAWRSDGLPERPTREAALFATEQHDVGWTEVDRAPLVDVTSGRPVDFVSAPTVVRHAVWRRALEVLAPQSTYAAALIAQHAITVYRRYRPDPEWTTFFIDMEQARDHWFSTATRPDGTHGGLLDPPLPMRRGFLQDYAVVGTGDLVSLVFCNGWTMPHAAEGYEVTLVGQQVRVVPDPFSGQHVALRVRARRVPNRPYATDGALRHALSTAPDEWLDGVAVGIDTSAQA